MSAKKSLTIDPPNCKYRAVLSITIGAELTLTAKVEVCSASMRETDEGSNYSMDLQITDMELSGDSSMAKKAKQSMGASDANSAKSFFIWRIIA